MGNPKEEDETRIEPRRRTLKSGKLIFADGKDPLNCQVVNWTTKGARLHFEVPYEGPKTFEIEIGFGELTLAKVAGKLAWQRSDDIGVQFDEELPFDVNF
jgi:hypothetical protein